MKACWSSKQSTVAITLLLSLTLTLNANAQEVSVMTFTVANTQPTVGNVDCGYDIVKAGEYAVWCSARVTDLNGIQDITGCNGTLYKTDKKYSNSQCTLHDKTKTSATCNCTFSIQHSGVEVEWTGNITAKDPNTKNSNTNTIKIGELPANTTSDTILVDEKPIQESRKNKTLHAETTFNPLTALQRLLWGQHVKGINRKLCTLNNVK